MRVLLIGLNSAPEIVGIAVYTSGLAVALNRNGHSVCQISGHPHFPAWRLFEGSPRFSYTKEKGDVEVIRCPLYVPAVPTGLRRIFHYISFAFMAFPMAIWQAVWHRPDVVFVVAPALLSAPVGWLSAKLSGASSWLHIQDFEVEAAFATGVLQEKSFLGRQAARFEQWILQRFDRVSSISSAMLEKLHRKGVSETRLYELRNWADLSCVLPVEDPLPMRAEFGITAPYIALYSGSIANKQGIDILPAVARCLSNRPDIAFVICGDGPYLDELKQQAAGLQNVHFFPLQPLDRLSDLLGMADVHLLPQIPGAANLVLPSKLTNMLASARPVIATAEPETALAREIEGCGLVVTPLNANALAKAVTNLIDAPELRRRYGMMARKRASERWNQDEIVHGLEEELFSLREKGRFSTVRNTALDAKKEPPRL